MRPVLAGDPRVAVAWLFGSAARGSMRPDSDVDVGIVFARGFPAGDRGRVVAELASLLERCAAPRPIDVVALEDQGSVFVHRALKDGKRIVVNDEEQRVEFETEATVRYFDWKPTWDIAAREQVPAMRRWLQEYLAR